MEFDTKHHVFVITIIFIIKKACFSYFFIIFAFKYIFAFKKYRL